MQENLVSTLSWAFPAYFGASVGLFYRRKCSLIELQKAAQMGHFKNLVIDPIVDDTLPEKQR